MNTPTWGTALSRALLALLAVLSVEAVAGTAWIQGAGEAGLDQPIDSTLTLFPGSVVRFQPTGDGFTLGWTPGWLCLVVGVVVFLVVARGRFVPVSR